MACDQFECVWLESQVSENPMPREVRPDQSKIMMGPIRKEPDGSLLLFVHVDIESAGAEKRGPIGEYLRSLLQKGCAIEVITGDHRYRPALAVF